MRAASPLIVNETGTRRFGPKRGLVMVVARGALPRAFASRKAARDGRSRLWARFFAVFTALTAGQMPASGAWRCPQAMESMDEIMSRSLFSSLSRKAPARCLALALAAVPLGLAGSSSAQPGNVALGIWYDDTGKGAVEILPCGTGKLCGRIVWLKEPISEKTGKPLVDAYNPEPEKRARPICGLQILGELARQSDGSWDDGWVYDPKVGKSYDAAIEVTGNRLTLTGYKGVKLFSKSFVWTKAPADLPRCNGTAAAAPPPAGTSAQPASQPVKR